MSDTTFNRYAKSAAAVLASILLTACSGGNTNSTALSDSASDGEEPVLDSPVSESDPRPIDQAAMPNLTSEGYLDMRAGLFAFPGAQGWGGNTRGGAGGKIVTVNTTKDVAVNGDGLISIREALESRNEVSAGPRIIVFSVGGLFDLTPHPVNELPELNWPRIVMQGEDDSYVTVACQTAPTPGVNIRGGGIYMWNNVHDHIWRHCTKRNDDEFIRYALTDLDQSNRTFSIDDFGGNMIFDHMSLSWSTDNNWHAYVNENANSPTLGKFTLSHSIVAEGDGSNASTNETFDSSQGPACLNNHLSSGINGCSFLSNFFTHNETRNGALWGASGEILNNIIYNYIDHGISVFDVMGTSQTDAWVMNNLIKEGPDGPGQSPIAAQGIITSESNFWIREAHFSPAQAQEIPAISIGDHFSPRISGVGENIKTLAMPGTQHMNCLGASKPQRDTLDQRWITEFYAGNGRIFNGPVAESRDYSTYPTDQTQHPNNHDTDSDGIADAWEQTWIDKGMTTTLDSMNHLSDADADGYLDIEEYINELAQCQ